MSDLSDHRLSAPRLLLDLKLCGDLLQCGEAAAEADLWREWLGLAAGARGGGFELDGSATALGWGDS